MVHKINSEEKLISNHWFQSISKEGPPHIPRISIPLSSPLWIIPWINLILSLSHRFDKSEIGARYRRWASDSLVAHGTSELWTIVQEVQDLEGISQLLWMPFNLILWRPSTIPAWSPVRIILQMQCPLPLQMAHKTVSAAQLPTTICTIHSSPLSDW